MRSLLLWLLLALPALAEDPGPDAEARPRPVVSEIVDYASAGRQGYVGVVAADTETDLGFLVIGTVASRPVDVGDIVAEGDLIAELDPADLDADLQAARAGVLVAQAQLRAATDAEARARSLSSRGVDAATRLEDATRNLAAAQARFDQAGATLARAEDARANAVLRAPQDGVITEVFAEPGATLAAGKEIVRLAGTGSREVVLDMTEQDVANLNPGTAFDVSLAAAPDVTAVAVLTRIDPVTERRTRTRRLHLALQDPPGSMRLGALVRIALRQGTDAALSLPISAILDPDTAPKVWVVDRAANRAGLRPVTLGARFADRVRIDAGLEPGTEVVLKGIHSLEDGQIVGRRETP